MHNGNFNAENSPNDSWKCKLITFANQTLHSRQRMQWILDGTKQQGRISPSLLEIPK